MTVDEIICGVAEGKDKRDRDGALGNVNIPRSWRKGTCGGG